MTRSELEHIIRAASAITNEYEIVVIGSQSILGQVPMAPETLLMSMEADVFALQQPDLSDLIDGSIGELSPFQQRFGYYAHGVSANTAVLPEGWKERLHKIQNDNTDLKIGYCLDVHDLASSKLVAGREKDLDFVGEMFRHDIINVTTLNERVAKLPIDDDHKRLLEQRITALQAGK